MAQQGAALQNYNNELVKCRFYFRNLSDSFKNLPNFKVLRTCALKEMTYNVK